MIWILGAVVLLLSGIVSARSLLVIRSRRKLLIDAFTRLRAERDDAAARLAMVSHAFRDVQRALRIEIDLHVANERARLVDALSPVCAELDALLATSAADDAVRAGVALARRDLQAAIARYRS